MRTAGRGSPQSCLLPVVNQYAGTRELSEQAVSVQISGSSLRSALRWSGDRKLLSAAAAGRKAAAQRSLGANHFAVHDVGRLSSLPGTESPAGPHHLQPLPKGRREQMFPVSPGFGAVRDAGHWHHPPGTYWVRVRTLGCWGAQSC